MKTEIVFAWRCDATNKDYRIVFHICKINDPERIDIMLVSISLYDNNSLVNPSRLKGGGEIKWIKMVQS